MRIVAWRELGVSCLGAVPRLFFAAGADGVGEIGVEVSINRPAWVFDRSRFHGVGLLSD